MKKLLIAAVLLIGMVASVMVLSSFIEPRQDEKIETPTTISDDGWREVGVYQAKGQKYGHWERFRIWEKDGMCNAYYWVLQNTSNDQNKDPDKTSCPKGALRQNSNNKWYAACNGEIYIIEDF